MNASKFYALQLQTTPREDLLYVDSRDNDSIELFDTILGRTLGNLSLADCCELPSDVSELLPLQGLLNAFEAEV